MSKQQKHFDIKAVLLADSFQTRFYPMTQDCPKTLFPLVNERLIEYSLYWLHLNGIKEIVILYQSKREQIEAYFAERQATRRQKTREEITLIYAQDAKSVGDAIRELHSNGIVHSDFILMHADTITNIDLQAALRCYFERREQSKSNILTQIVTKRNKVRSPLSDEEDFYVYTIDNNNQMLQLDNLIAKTSGRFSKERIKMDKGQSVNSMIRSDLVDTEIYICSFDVLNYFQENFMHNHIRDDFMREILYSEIKEEAIHIHEVPQTQISLRIKNPRLMYIASQLLLQGYFKPFAPDAQLWKNPYSYDDLYRYFGSESKPHHKAIISDVSAVGPKSLIGERSQIINSIIGANCKIAQDCIVRNSILFDEVELKEGVCIDSSMLASRVVVGANSIVERGSLISYDVQIKANRNIPEYSRVGCFNLSMPENEFCLRGSLFERGDPTLSMGSTQEYYIQLISDSSQPGLENQDLTLEAHHKSQPTKEDFFVEELKLLVQECKDNPQSVNQAALQIDTMKLNYNKSIVQCIEAFMPGVLCSLLERTYENSQEQLIALTQKFTVYKEFLQKYIHGPEEAEAFIQEIEDFCYRNEAFTKCIHIFFQLAFKSEILTGQHILRWKTKKEPSSDPIIQSFIKLNEGFLQWLKNQEEDEEEDEDEEDNDEEDDEQQQ